MELVSKQMVIDAIEDTTWYHINENGKLVEGANSADHTPLYKADDIFKAIKTVFPVHGYWIKLYENNYKCSQCGDWWESDRHPLDNGMDYCPHCGAYMKG